MRGTECTAKAVSHRITHIKKLVESLVPSDGGPPASNGNGAASTTPKTPKSPKSNNKKRGAANGDEGGSPTPSKKAKTPKGKGKGKKGAAEVKEEDAEVKEEDVEVKEEDGENGDKIKSESDTGATGDANGDDA